jgi:hypothetical protein
MPTDSSSQQAEAKSDDWLTETTPTKDPIMLLWELPAKDGTIKPVRSKQPKERYL